MLKWRLLRRKPSSSLGVVRAPSRNRLLSIIFLGIIFTRLLRPGTRGRTAAWISRFDSSACLSITWHRRPSSAPMGRFGGGWQWVVGVQAGPSTVIVNLLVGYLRISRRWKR